MTRCQVGWLTTGVTVSLRLIRGGRHIRRRIYESALFEAACIGALTVTLVAESLLLCRQICLRHEQTARILIVANHPRETGHG